MSQEANEDQYLACGMENFTWASHSFHLGHSGARDISKKDNLHWERAGLRRESNQLEENIVFSKENDADSILAQAMDGVKIDRLVIW